MNYKITDKILCIPPHISTTWDQIVFLQTETDSPNSNLTLIIHLIDQKIVKIPDLEPGIIDVLFAAHVGFLEKKGKISKDNKANPHAFFLQNVLGISPDQLSSLSIRLGPGNMGNLGGGLEGMESAMQHDSSKTNSPDLPKEILEKISQFIKILTGGDINNFPPPEPHCNCVHCQIARSIHKKESSPDSQEPEEEIVAEKDLQFREWDIKQTGDQLFRVTNPLDTTEKYDVYLGNPVGCTCGNPHCDHIKAVLFS